MKGVEILKFILGDEIAYNKFGGIFAVDQMNFPLPNNDVFFICNTDIYKNEGKHWIVIYFSKDLSYIEYFDSLGKKPTEKFVKFMSQSGKQILFSVKRIQSKSSYACGYFCLYFIFLRCRNIYFDTIINVFSTNMKKNEEKAIKFVKHFI